MCVADTLCPTAALCRSPDVDGRTPLHWAAYKGHANALRLLLVLDARLGLGDREGCTPLHWAAIRGNSEACTVLLQARAAGGPHARGCMLEPGPDRPLHGHLVLDAVRP